MKGNYFLLNHGFAKTPISENCVNLAESLVDLLNGLGEHLASNSTDFHLKINCRLELINMSTFSSFRNWLAVLQKSWMVLSLSTKLSKRWKTSCSLKSHDLHTFRSSLSSSFFLSLSLSLYSSLSLSSSFSLSSCPLFLSSSSLKYEGHLALYSWKKLWSGGGNYDDDPPETGFWTPWASSAKLSPCPKLPPPVFHLDFYQLAVNNKDTSTCFELQDFLECIKYYNWGFSVSRTCLL